jgi:hypothetical protein
MNDVDPAPPMPIRCAGCGRELPGGTAACRAQFEELVGRDFSNVLYGRVHRTFVDVYALQHPDAYGASAKSLAAHLMGLCWALEHGAPMAVGPDPLRAWLDGRPQLTRPDVPTFRGRLTLADVGVASTPEEHAQLVDRWARSTWEAYAPLHATAREWIRRALAGEKLPRRWRAGPAQDFTLNK